MFSTFLVVLMLIKKKKNHLTDRPVPVWGTLNNNINTLVFFGVSLMFYFKTGYFFLQESDTPRSDTDSEEEEYRTHRTLTKKPSPLGNFSRDSVRQSLSNRPEMFRWLEAQEKQQAQFSKKVSEGGSEKRSVPAHCDKKGYHKLSSYRRSVQL